MRCPTLADLPPPPPGKTGWPWTVETPQLPAGRADGTPWPRISIVTPSYNQGRFIEETIRSVLLQGYPDLEYIVIDGGSSDGAVDIIRKYASWLTHWVSEPDRGQAHAINKGIDCASGLVVNWLNSDDVFAPDALRHVGRLFGTEWCCDTLAGFSEIRSEDGSRSLWKIEALPRSFLDLCQYLDGRFLAQPSVFFTRQAFNRVGCLREDLHYAMDLDLWLRFARDGLIFATNRHLSWMRQHADAKTYRSELLVLDEVDRILDSYRGSLPDTFMRRSRAKLHRRRSDAWSNEGLRAYFSGDRRLAWRALLMAFVHAKLSVLSRSWLGLLLRLACPKPVTAYILHRP